MLAACAPTPPRIQTIVPSQNASAVPTDSEIRIAFDRAVDHPSVERRLQIDPPLPGCGPGAGACRLAWSQNTLRVEHDQNLQPGTRYSVRLQPGFQDLQGRTNPLDHLWSFVTEASPAVTGLDPGPQSTRVSPARDLVLTFSRAMRPESVQAGIRLTPDVPLRVVQNPSNHAQFQIAPIQLLRARTDYTLEVSFDVRDIHGNALAATVRSTFSTAEMGFPAMVSYLASPPDGGPRATVGLVDPHPNLIAGRLLPKVIFDESATPEQATLLDFWWLPDGKSLVLLRRPQHGEPELAAFDLTSGILRELGIRASAAALAPDGARLAYVHNRELHLVGLLDHHDRLLAGGDALATPPTFSPDGRTLAYVAADGEASRIYLVNLDVGSRFRIPSIDDPTDQPAWAPDGDKLAFRRWRNGKASLWLFFLANAPGPAQRRVADVNLEQCVWLDSTTVVGVTHHAGRSALVGVNVFSADENSTGRPLTRADTVLTGDEPSVPPYDRRVTFTSEVGGQAQVWVMNADGSAPLQLTYAEAGLVASRPKWTPKPAAAP